MLQPSMKAVICQRWFSDERVETAFVDYGHVRVSPITLHSMKGILFIIVQTACGSGWVLNFQHLANISEDPPRFTVLHDGANLGASICL